MLNIINYELRHMKNSVDDLKREVNDLKAEINLSKTRSQTNFAKRMELQSKQ